MRFPIDTNDRKPIGRSGETVSAIGLGTWAIRDYRMAEEVLAAAPSYGIDNIDTAEMYGSGAAEELVGRVIRRVGREAYFITTKMLPHHLRSRDEVLKAARASLRRLGLPYVDLFLIHWPEPTLPISTQVRNFEAVYEEGLARYIGVSNFSVREMRIAMESLKSAEIVANQVHYSILAKDVEHDLLREAIKEGVTIQAYTPLERGEVAEHPVVREVARKVGKTPIQVALNYLISRPRVVAIPKTERIEHLREIAGAMGWRLDEEDMKLLEECC